MKHLSEDLPPIALQVGALYALAASAYLDLTPWDYYTPDGELRPAAATAEALIHKVLGLEPTNPLALHLHIHLAEAGAPGAEKEAKVPNAVRGKKSADTLAGLNVQQGHLVHMPSHLYVRWGGPESRGGFKGGPGGGVIEGGLEVGSERGRWALRALKDGGVGGRSCGGWSRGISDGEGSIEGQRKVRDGVVVGRRGPGVEKRGF